MTDNSSMPQADSTGQRSQALAVRSSSLVHRGQDLLRTLEPRVLRFPDDCELGSIQRRDRDGRPHAPDWLWAYVQESGGDFYAEASGEIVVPPGGDVCLEALGTPDLWFYWNGIRTPPDDYVGPDFSPLSLLGPNDLQRIDFHYNAVMDADLAHISGLTGLRMLCLGRTPVTDAGLPYLTGLRSLEELHLWRNHITDAGLVHIANLSALRILNLGYTRVTDAGLSHLKDLAALEDFCLRGTAVYGSGLQYLSRLRSLEDIDLQESAVTDDGLAILCNYQSLRAINLRHSDITDAGLTNLPNLKSLDWIDLGYTSITDAGIANLFSLKAPGFIGLKRSKVTEQCADRLRKFFPRVRIDWSAYEE